MAATITDLGNGTSITSDQTVVTGATITASVGDWLVIIAAAANAVVNGLPSITTCVDSDGVNVYTRVARVNFSPGAAANDGATVAIFVGRVNQALSSDTITINHSVNTPQKSVQVYRVQPGANETITVIAADDVGATGNATTHSANTVSVINGDIIFGAAAIETDDAVTGDSDTTNGNWSSILTRLADGGADAATMSCSSQHKTVNATGDQSWACTTVSARDSARSYLILRSAIPTIDSWFQPVVQPKAAIRPQSLKTELADPLLPIAAPPAVLFDWFVPLEPQPRQRKLPPYNPEAYALRGPEPGTATGAVPSGWQNPLPWFKRKLPPFDPKAEPILPTGLSVPFDWFVNLSPPAKPKKLPQFNPAAQPEAVIVSFGWFTPLVQPAKPLRRDLSISVEPLQPMAAAPAAVTMDMWFVQLVEPPYNNRKIFYESIVFPISPLDTNFDWFQPLSQPYRGRKLPPFNPAADPLLPAAASPPGPGDATGAVAAGWQNPLRWFKRKLPPYDPKAEPILPMAQAQETVTIDKWFVPFTDPIRKPRPKLSSQVIEPLPPMVVTIDRWYVPFVDPRRAPSRVRFSAQSVEPILAVVPDNGTVDKWFVPFMARPKPRSTFHLRVPAVAEPLFPDPVPPAPPTNLPEVRMIARVGTLMGRP